MCNFINNVRICKDCTSYLNDMPSETRLQKCNAAHHTHTQCLNIPIIDDKIRGASCRACLLKSREQFARERRLLSPDHEMATRHLRRGNMDIDACARELRECEGMMFHKDTKGLASNYEAPQAWRPKIEEVFKMMDLEAGEVVRLDEEDQSDNFDIHAEITGTKTPPRTPSPPVNPYLWWINDRKIKMKKIKAQITLDAREDIESPYVSETWSSSRTSLPTSSASSSSGTGRGSPDLVRSSETFKMVDLSHDRFYDVNLGDEVAETRKDAASPSSWKSWLGGSLNSWMVFRHQNEY